MMSAVTSPIRSVLYLPAANERALEKARTLPCDAVIVDLEDAVAPDAKDVARHRAVSALRAGGFGRRVLTVRCNALDTEWGLEDLAAVVPAGPDAIILPKVTGVADLRRCADALRSIDGGTSVRLWPMIETPSAILDARDIAAHERVDVLVMGTNDLTLELRAEAVPGRAPLVPHLAMALAAARAEGVRIVDGVFNDIGDAAGFEAECRQGRALGFDGKTLIHPSQIEPCNAAWTPSEAEVEHAHRVIEAFGAAQAAGRGVATVDGRMVENLHVEMARRVLDLAKS
jgi:citrate lyase subunit beta/citryl-CoA lyase